MNEDKPTEIVGTYRDDIQVGGIYPNTLVSKYADQFNCTLKILREVTEADWRNKYQYLGEIPDDPLRREPRYFEVLALD